MKSAGTKKYVAAPAANVVVCAGPAILHGIIIGADVNASTIEVSDSPSDGDGDVHILLTGNTLMTSTGGYVKVEAHFEKGITSDIAAQTNVTFVYSPF